MKRIAIVFFTIAVFSLSLTAQEEKGNIKIEKKSKNAVIKVKPDSDVVVIINDKKYDSDILDLIDPARIESINVLKGEKAQEKYDSESVIIIKTKLVPPKDKIVIKATDSDKGEELVPLYVIDGEISTKTDLDAISPDDIKSVSVLKGESAIKIYGNAGANGVVIIEMKKRKK